MRNKFVETCPIFVGWRSCGLGVDGCEVAKACKTKAMEKGGLVQIGHCCEDAMAALWFVHNSYERAMSLLPRVREQRIGIPGCRETNSRRRLPGPRSQATSAHRVVNDPAATEADRNIGAAECGQQFSSHPERASDTYS